MDWRFEIQLANSMFACFCFTEIIFADIPGSSSSFRAAARFLQYSSTVRGVPVLTGCNLHDLWSVLHAELHVLNDGDDLVDGLLEGPHRPLEARDLHYRHHLVFDNYRILDAPGYNSLQRTTCSPGRQLSAPRLGRCMRLRRLSAPLGGARNGMRQPRWPLVDLLGVLGAAFGESLLLLPVSTVCLSAGFLGITFLCDVLGIGTRWLNAPIYYGCIYGPFVSVYVLAKRRALAVRQHLPF
ncbi:hypothetical protein CYMTET_35074 [Cymbomonas tetramitiformis]|uniref:Uncharacterized protein n=1 Tax=Cymbomonas tetramitiformis TaxID=36881 RepID=A0AAE0F9T9_9CHLO|nr:hypothetical protein CYMTET_45218 [Cymbomonas tetramitiformis]KAK3255761.1 hypothetical protein CYMTET_35074 [Cymbomonas tetramitiformis]